ncbi:MAG: Na/Pi symporter [Sutterella sp.]|nr:Na/Pi symporter [Sutterella sp.]
MHSLIQLMGGVSLILWGTYMVKTGMLRTFGEPLRQWISTKVDNRLVGFVTGIGLSSLLQSATASSLLVAGLQSKGLLSTTLALSCVLGADLGSAVMSWVLTLDLRFLSPLLVTVGTIFFLRYPNKSLGQFGRVLLGLGLIMLALSLIFAATYPIKSSEGIHTLINAAATYPWVCLFLGVSLAMVCFSSLAVVVILASLVKAGVLLLPTALWMVLGANLGSALLAVLTTMKASAIARRAPVGNLIYRAVGVLVGIVVIGLWPVAATLSAWSESVLWFHIGFNAMLGGLGLISVRRLAQYLDQWLPSCLRTDSNEMAPLSLENLQDSKTILSSAKDGLLKSLSLLQTQWSHVAWLIQTNPPLGEILRLDDDAKLITRRSRAISRLLMILTQEPMTLDEAQVWQKYKNLNASIRMASEVANRMIETLAQNKCQDGLSFSLRGAEELLHENDRVAGNIARIRALVEVQETEQRAQLWAELEADKAQMHQAEYELIERHLARVAQGQTASVATRALHLELLTLFRRFNAILCASEE